MLAINQKNPPIGFSADDLSVIKQQGYKRVSHNVCARDLGNTVGTVITIKKQNAGFAVMAVEDWPKHEAHRVKFLGDTANPLGECIQKAQRLLTIIGTPVPENATAPIKEPIC